MKMQISQRLCKSDFTDTCCYPFLAIHQVWFHFNIHFSHYFYLVTQVKILIFQNLNFLRNTNLVGALDIWF